MEIFRHGMSKDTLNVMLLICCRYRCCVRFCSVRKSLQQLLYIFHWWMALCWMHYYTVSREMIFGHKHCGRSIEYHVVWKALLFHVLPAGNVVFVISVPRVVVLVIVIAFQRLTRMKHWGRLHGVSFIRQRKQISRFYLPQPITRSKWTPCKHDGLNIHILKWRCTTKQISLLLLASTGGYSNTMLILGFRISLLIRNIYF